MEQGNFGKGVGTLSIAGMDLSTIYESLNRDLSSSHRVHCVCIPYITNMFRSLYTAIPSSLKMGFRVAKINYASKRAALIVYKHFFLHCFREKGI